MFVVLSLMDVAIIAFIFKEIQEELNKQSK